MDANVANISRLMIQWEFILIPINYSKVGKKIMEVIVV